MGVVVDLLFLVVLVLIGVVVGTIVARKTDAATPALKIVLAILGAVIGMVIGRTLLSGLVGSRASAVIVVILSVVVMSTLLALIPTGKKHAPGLAGPPTPGMNSMANDARRAAEQSKTEEQQRLSNRSQAEAWYRTTIDKLAAEFVAGARELGIKPAKRTGAKLTDPSYYTVTVHYGLSDSEGRSSTSELHIRANGSWNFARSTDAILPSTVPPNCEAELRKSFTNALALRAAHPEWPEPHARPLY